MVLLFPMIGACGALAFPIVLVAAWRLRSKVRKRRMVR